MNKNTQETLFSSAKQDWETPQDLFESLSDKYGPFDLDAAASLNNTKVSKFCTVDGVYEARGFTESRMLYGTDGLTSRWHTLGKRVWLNPPYGRGIGKWIKKAYEESQEGCTVVCLLPARVDTRWFHDYIYGKPTVHLVLLSGRVRFVGAKSSAPFPSMVVIFYPNKEQEK